MIALLILIVPIAVVAYFGAHWTYREGYRHGYKDSQWDTEFPEHADGPLFDLDGWS